MPGEGTPSWKPADLARRAKPGLDLIGHVRGGTSKQPGSGAAGPVYKITLGRKDIRLEEMGARIESQMGLNSWAAFFGLDENAVVAGAPSLTSFRAANYYPFK